MRGVFSGDLVRQAVDLLLHQCDNGAGRDNREGPYAGADSVLRNLRPDDGLGVSVRMKMRIVSTCPTLASPTTTTTWRLRSVLVAFFYIFLQLTPAFGL